MAENIITLLISGAMILGLFGMIWEHIAQRLRGKPAGQAPLSGISRVDLILIALFFAPIFVAFYNSLHFVLTWA